MCVWHFWLTSNWTLSACTPHHPLPLPCIPLWVKVVSLSWRDLVECLIAQLDVAWLGSARPVEFLLLSHWPFGPRPSHNQLLKLLRCLLLHLSTSFTLLPPPLHSCTSLTFSLLSPFSSHFCMALLVIFSIGFTAIFGLIMRAFEIAYLVACPSVCPSACLSVGLSAWLADWLVAHMLQARLDCIWRQLSLICWLEICEKQTQTCLPLPIPLSTLFHYKKYHEILKTENLSRQFHFSLSPARCKFVPASLSPESFVSLRTMSCNCLGFGFVFGLISMAAAWLVLATAHRKLPPLPSLHHSPFPCQAFS